MYWRVNLSLIAAAIALSLSGVACAEFGLETEGNPAARSARLRASDDAPRLTVVDLSQPLEPDIPVFPGGVAFTVETIATIDQGYYSRKFAMGEHTGTHVDAPGHFVAGAGLLDSLSPSDLIAPLVVIDVHDQCAADPDFTLDVDTVLAWERTHGTVPSGAVVALATGWERRWHDPDRYRNADAAGTMHFPGFGADAAEFLAVNRRVRAVGIDALSTDPGRSQDFAEHKAFLKHGTYQIENLRNLDLVPATGATVLVGVLPLRDGSGAPARVLAVLPETAE